MRPKNSRSPFFPDGILPVRLIFQIFWSCLLGPGRFLRFLGWGGSASTGCSSERGRALSSTEVTSSAISGASSATPVMLVLRRSYLLLEPDLMLRELARSCNLARGTSMRKLIFEVVGRRQVDQKWHLAFPISYATLGVTM